MNLLNKVGNVVLKRGDIVKSPSGSSEWVVIDNEAIGNKIALACVSKYMTKDGDEMKEWYKVR